MTTPADKIDLLKAYKAAQYAAIIAKGGKIADASDWLSYEAAIAAIPSVVPNVIANMPFTAGAEPLGGTVWYVRPDGAGLKDGTSWDNALATRAEAVNAASPGDQVRVWEGTYYLEQIQAPKAGVSEYYGFNDDGTWATRQPFTHPSKLDAGFTANNFENTSVTFLDEQIIDGLWVQNAIKSGYGGGMNLSVRSYLRNCTITNSSASTGGGGVYAHSGSVLNNCVVTNNSASGGYGGGGAYSIGSVLNNCVVTNNSATGNGGGVHANSSVLNNCVVTNNSATGNGGGAHVIDGGLTNCAITSCRSTTGGGVSVDRGRLTNCAITNCSGTNGGGVNANGGSVLNNCAITNCSGTTGGGVYVYNGSRCYNVTCAMNTATTGDNFYLTNTSQILYNCASWGGNIYLAQANYAYKIYNCASNFALTGVTNWHTQADVQNFLTLTDFPFAAPGVAPYDGSGALYHAGTIGRTDEALAFVERFVLPKMLDAHLPAGSPLIGAGYYEAGVTPETDADGKERPITPSIGAYEP